MLLGRSPRVLHEQKQQLRLALRPLLQDEDAYVVVGPRDLPERQREVPLVLPGHGEPSPIQVHGRTEAEFVAPVTRTLDNPQFISKHLLLHLPAAYAALPYLERLVLWLHVKCEYRLAAIVETLRPLGVRRPSQVRDVEEAALAQLAGMLWDEAGHATLPPEKGV